MASLFRQLRRESLKPKKTIIGVYGAHNPMNLLVDGDILLVFDDKTDMETYLNSKTPKFPMPASIKPMYFEEMMQGFAMGGRYGMRRGVAEKFLVAWSKSYTEKPPFDREEINKEGDFLSLIPM